MRITRKRYAMISVTPDDEERLKSAIKAALESVELELDCVGLDDTARARCMFTKQTLEWFASALDNAN